MKTIKRIKATANQKKRTFTIRVFNGKELTAKYRTYKMSLDEFESCEYFTSSDWIEFLKTEAYYKV